jgi:hypothetical protein
VQIWTRKTQNIATTPASGAGAAEARNFTYPVSTTLDRHGGDPSKNMVYSYAFRRGTFVAGTGTFVPENRGFGGVIINPASKLVSETGDVVGGMPGVDGGTSGCSCVWKYLLD